jgi:hypothetical protein
LTLTILFPPLLFFVKKSGKHQGHQIRFTKSERALNSMNQEWILFTITKRLSQNRQMQMMMKTLLALIAIISLLACAANLPSNAPSIEPDRDGKSSAENRPVVKDPAKPLKSPHGYIITKDYQPGGFGGFIGDCSSDKNWPYYWQCMSENAGNGGFK